MAVGSRNIEDDKQRSTGVMLCSTLVLDNTNCSSVFNILNSDVVKGIMN